MRSDKPPSSARRSAWRFAGSRRGSVPFSEGGGSPLARPSDPRAPRNFMSSFDSPPRSPLAARDRGAPPRSPLATAGHDRARDRGAPPRSPLARRSGGVASAGSSHHESAAAGSPPQRERRGSGRWSSPDRDSPLPGGSRPMGERDRDGRRGERCVQS